MFFHHIHFHRPNRLFPRGSSRTYSFNARASAIWFRFLEINALVEPEWAEAWLEARLRLESAS